ncbi:MAG: DUF2788 domain-containing protein [Ketobacteraceae bacterium]|nr:DUF2788 domain-containing protein [Ketobacteraceae bacterium]
MDLQQFETISLYVCVSGLILYMLYIMFKLAQESQAGKMGTAAIFGTLGLGILGFIVKEVLTVVIQV